MPQNIVVGEDAEAVADFVAKYSGTERETDDAQLRPMLDLKAIRRDPDAVRAALARRSDGSDARLDEALALDARRRELLPEVEGLRARQNEASQAIARAKKEGGDAADAIAEMQEVSRRVKALSEELATVEAAARAACSR